MVRIRGNGLGLVGHGTETPPKDIQIVPQDIFQAPDETDAPPLRFRGRFGGANDRTFFGLGRHGQILDVAEAAQGRRYWRAVARGDPVVPVQAGIFQKKGTGLHAPEGIGGNDRAELAQVGTRITLDFRRLGDEEHTPFARNAGGRARGRLVKDHQPGSTAVLVLQDKAYVPHAARSVFRLAQPGPGRVHGAEKAVHHPLFLHSEGQVGQAPRSAA